MSSNNLMINGMSEAQQDNLNELQEYFTGLPFDNSAQGVSSNPQQFGQDFSGFHPNTFDGSKQWVDVNNLMENVGSNNTYYNQTFVPSSTFYHSMQQAELSKDSPASSIPQHPSTVNFGYHPYQRYSNPQERISKENPACSMSQAPVNFSGSHPSQGYFYPQQTFMNEYFVASPQNQGQQMVQQPFYDFPQYEQEEVKGIIRTSRGRGRPKGSKNKTPEERPEKKKRVADPEKTAFTYNHLITLALLNFPNEMATVHGLYKYSEHIVPSISNKDSWKNTLRHALSPMTGFARIENISGSTGKAGFWTIMPERRNELIQSIQNKIKENEECMANLKLRDLGDLPAILSGNHPLPEEESIIQIPVPKVSEAGPTTSNESSENFKTGYPQVPYFAQYAPQQSFGQYPPMSAGPMYSNPSEPAHPNAPYYPYGMAQSGYGMPYFAYPKQEASNANCPSSSVPQQEYQHYGYTNDFNQMNGGFQAGSVPQQGFQQQMFVNQDFAPYDQQFQPYQPELSVNGKPLTYL